jgi:hypothetical protein
MSVPPHPHPLTTAPCFRFCGSFWSLHSSRGCTAAQQNQRPPVAASPCARFGAWPLPLICPESGRDAAAASRTQRAAALAACALRLVATWTLAQRRTAPRVAADGPPSALSYFLRCLPCYFPMFSRTHNLILWPSDVCPAVQSSKIYPGRTRAAPLGGNPP